jgi:hypothetical protein
MLISCWFLEFSKSIIRVKTIRGEVSADIVHISKIKWGSLIDSIGNFCTLKFINIYFLLVYIWGQHTDDKILHCKILKGLFKRFYYLNRANENIYRHQISS